MPNLYDYLDWRGDLALDRVPFNDVDAMILARVSYLPFDGIVPSGFKKQISLGEANAALSAAGEAARYIMRADRDLLPALADCPRFKSMRLSGFVNRIDAASEKQFSALAITPGNGAQFVSFRGTDDTMVGWKEDFNMSFMSRVPSQIEAVGYLEAAAEALPGGLVLGGHSKGGNLAVYAAAFCRPWLQQRVSKVYNYDGPGFHAEIMAEYGYLAVRDKIATIVPQSSVIGLLLEHEEDLGIISSSQRGFMQHDLYSWEVRRDNFIYLEATTGGSRFVDQTLRAWLAEMDSEARASFIEGLYSIIGSTGAKNFKELAAKKWHEHALAGLQALISLDERSRAALGKTLLSLGRAARGNLHLVLPGFMGRKNDMKESAEAKDA